MANMTDSNNADGFKYPIEVFTAQNPTKTLSVESHLAVAKTADQQSPLKVYHEKFSLYKYAIVEKKDNEPLSIYANINIKEIEALMKRSDYAFMKHMDAEFGPKVDTDTTSPAYTVRIASGMLKGKTPAEVLLEGDNEEALNRQYTFLKEHLDKFPKNKIQMDAILDAAKLKKEGKLTKSSASSTRVRLYPNGQDIVPKPLIRKKREDNKCFVYEMEIYWYIGDKYPVEIKINNYYAVVHEDNTGRVQPDKSTIDKKESWTRSFRLSEQDWQNHVRSIRTDMANFEMLHAKETRMDAENTSKANREKATT